MAPLNPKYWQDRHKRKRLEFPELYLWRSAKYRAKARGLPFDIEQSDIIIPPYCPVLGIKLTPKEGRLTDSSPTVDRIIGKLGYVKGNVEVISWRANRLKGDATPKDLKRLAKYYGKKSRKPIASKD